MATKKAKTKAKARSTKSNGNARKSARSGASAQRRRTKPPSRMTPAKKSSKPGAAKRGSKKSIPTKKSATKRAGSTSKAGATKKPAAKRGTTASGSRRSKPRSTGTTARKIGRAVVQLKPKARKAARSVGSGVRKAASKVQTAVTSTKKSLAARGRSAKKGAGTGTSTATRKQPSRKPAAGRATASPKAIGPNKTADIAAIRGKQLPLGGSALATRNEEDDYTPHQLSSKAPFRGGGAEVDDELPTEMSTNGRFSDEDRFTNHSHDPRIGTHNRTYEPAEAPARGGAESDDDEDFEPE